MRRYSIFLAVVWLCACNREAEAPAATAVTELPPSAAGPEKSKATPGAQEATAAPAAPNAGGLTWSVQAPLVARAPKSSMRAAEYGIEGEALAELTVFYFGPGQGGAVDANITRWLGQLTQADGSDTAKRAKRAQRQVSGIDVTTVEASGNYAGGMAMPGAPAPAAIDGALLLGAIASGPEGPVFFKLIGPGAAVERARPAFEALVSSLHKP